MKARYYVVQVHHVKEGWVDLPKTASFKEKEARDASMATTVQFQRVTRVVRKPHGWTPEGKEDPYLPPLDYSLKDQVAAARKNKQDG